MVASNAGAYSVEVGEHAWGLLLAAAKRVVEHRSRVEGGAKTLGEFAGEARGIVVLRGKTLGIVGYGGIGGSVVPYAKAFGMRVSAFTRHERRERGVEFFQGREGLESLLEQSDVVLLSLPLTDLTHGLIGGGALSLMKENAILVNIGRGDLVDQRAPIFGSGAIRISGTRPTSGGTAREGDARDGLPVRVASELRRHAPYVRADGGGFWAARQARR